MNIWSRILKENRLYSSIFIIIHLYLSIFKMYVSQLVHGPTSKADSRAAPRRLEVSFAQKGQDLQELIDIMDRLKIPADKRP
jgi:hypothetical protein